MEEKLLDFVRFLDAVEIGAV